MGWVKEIFKNSSKLSFSMVLSFSEYACSSSSWLRFLSLLLGWSSWNEDFTDSLRDEKEVDGFLRPVVGLESAKEDFKGVLSMEFVINLCFEYLFESEIAGYLSSESGFKSLAFETLRIIFLKRYFISSSVPFLRFFSDM